VTRGFGQLIERVDVQGPLGLGGHEGQLLATCNDQIEPMLLQPLSTKPGLSKGRLFGNLIDPEQQHPAGSCWKGEAF
jgi:hypothetical protein